jgi:O-methyltransferase
MNLMVYQSLLDKFPIISDQMKRPALEIVLGELERTLSGGVAGDIVEFGCYIGTTSLFLRRLLDEHGETGARQLHVYDSFAGLPPKVQQDMTPVGADFKAGELSVSKKQLLAEFQKARLQPPSVHKAWFHELTATDVPEHIAFAFLDGDFYQSMIDSLRLVWPRLSPGGIACIDDYKRDALPGVERAIRDFFQDKPQQIRVAHNIGVIRT